MIEIHLYGKLRKYAPNSNVNQNSVIKVSPGETETIESLFSKIDISVDQIFHLFLNNKLLYTQNTLAETLGYQKTDADFNDWDLSLAVKSGDRIGLFGRDMATLVV